MLRRWWVPRWWWWWWWRYYEKGWSPPWSGYSLVAVVIVPKEVTEPVKLEGT